jgi:hypothetical protein
MELKKKTAEVRGYVNNLMFKQPENMAMCWSVHVFAFHNSERNTFDVTLVWNARYISFEVNKSA